MSGADAWQQGSRIRVFTPDGELKIIKGYGVPRRISTPELAPDGANKSFVMRPGPWTFDGWFEINPEDAAGLTYGSTVFVINEIVGAACRAYVTPSSSPVLKKDLNLWFDFQSNGVFFRTEVSAEDVVGQMKNEVCYLAPWGGQHEYRERGQT